jgi:hypothetical protein
MSAENENRESRIEDSGSSGSILDPPSSILAHAEGVCVFCGCTEENCQQCIDRTGAPCFWANAARTFCSACLFLMFKEILVDNAPLR